MIKQASIILAVLAAACGIANAEVQETGYRQMTGTKNILVIRFSTPDSVNTMTYSTAVSNMGIVQQRTEESSYHRLHLTFEVAPNVLTLPHTSAYYTALPVAQTADAIKADAVALAQGAGYAISMTNYGNYDRLACLLPPASKFNWRFKHTVYVTAAVPTAILHELGHSWLFPHSSRWQVSDGNPLSPTGHIVEYGDVFDIMGVTYDPHYNQVDYSEFDKYWAGWIDDSQITISNQPGTYTYTVTAFDNVNATGTLAVRVPYDSTHDYWIAYRRGFLSATDGRQASAHGAYIVRAPNVVMDYNKILPYRTLLIDTQTPGTVPGDACLPIGKTLTDSVHGISITTVAEGTDSLTIQVVRQ